jgi:Outer membrane protein beta-barrel domain
MRIAWLVLALVMTLGSAASGQRLYWGVIAGTNLTPDFPRSDMSGPADVYGNPAYQVERQPGPHSFILGGLLQVQLSSNFAIEADALYRALPGISIDTIFPAGGPAVTTRYNIPSANTWEFPVMLQWNLPSPLIWGRVRPFLEGGAAFRTSQDDTGAQPSQFGVTAGVGAAIHFGNLRVAPTIRYTRWNKDGGFPNYPTKADQLEFLTSAAWGTSSNPAHATGHRLSLGVIGGLSLLGEFYYPDSGVRERIGYLAGASGQLELRQNLTLEVDATYKPLHSSFGEGAGFTVLSWDFPVLAKYHLAKLGRAPFVEAGPSFRAAGNLNGYNPSHFGVTVGAGAETRQAWALLSTALRYTRWTKDGLPNSSLQTGGQSDYPRTNVNAVELIFGAGF